MKTAAVLALGIGSMFSLGAIASDLEAKTDKSSYKTEAERRQNVKIMSIEDAMYVSPHKLEKRRQKVGAITGYVPVNFVPARTGPELKRMISSFWDDLKTKVRNATSLEKFINNYFLDYLNNPIVKNEIPMADRYQQIELALYNSNLNETQKAELCFKHLLGTCKQSFKGQLTKEDNQAMYDISVLVKKYYKEDHPEALNKVNGKIKAFINSYKSFVDMYK